MEHSEGGGNQEGRSQLPRQYQQGQRQQPIHQQGQQQSDPAGSIPGAVLPWTTQQQQQFQQQQELYLRQQQSAASVYGPSGVGSGIGGHLHPSDRIMAAAPSIHQQQQRQHPTEYLIAQQQQQQRYLQQQQYAASLGAGYPPGVPQQQYTQQLSYQQQLAMQMAAAQHTHLVGVDPALLAAAVASGGLPPHLQQQQQQIHPSHHPSIPPTMQAVPAQASQLPQPTVQARVGRLPADRPIIKLSLSLIDTYKHINDVYYQEREARKAAKAKQEKVTSAAAATIPASASAKKPSGGSDSKPASKQAPQQGSGANNNGWDDDNYDYIINPGELFYEGRYRIKERIGKGSFGQVVRADDLQEGVEVAIKIIKSKKPFLMQAKTEIELLMHLNDKDTDDQYNIGEYMIVK